MSFSRQGHQANPLFFSEQSINADDISISRFWQLAGMATNVPVTSFSPTTFHPSCSAMPAFLHYQRSAYDYVAAINTVNQG